MSLHPLERLASAKDDLDLEFALEVQTKLAREEKMELNRQTEEDAFAARLLTMSLQDEDYARALQVTPTAAY
jgi:hypothetical protein